MREPSKRGVMAVAAAAVFIFASIEMYTLNQLRSVEEQLGDVQSQLAQTKDLLSLQADPSASKQESKERERAIAALREQMQAAREQAQAIAGTVKKEALRSVEDLNARVNANAENLRQTHAALATELNGVKEATSSNLAAVSNEVAEVKQEVSATKDQLSATIADLKRVNGDLGIMSGLIATNAREVEALRQVGDRTYTEFTLLRTKQPQRVGDVWLLLKKSDPGKNRFTVEVSADDRKIEKRDKGVNEPVQFYVGRDRQPHELVVNSIQKNGIVGYIASPKAVAISSR